MKKFLVYVLVDPRTGAPRYVGRSSSGLRRPRRHIHDSELRACEGTHKARWIRQLKRLGLRYSIDVIYASDVDIALSEAEVFWIAELRRRGFDLTNSTDGGEGQRGHVFSLEHRKKISEAKRGVRFTPEHRAKISAANKNRSSETRAKLSAAARNRSPETLMAISEGRRRNLQDPDFLERNKDCHARQRKPFSDQNGTVYKSKREAAAALGISVAGVADVLKGRAKQCHGWVFVYLPEGH